MKKLILSIAIIGTMLSCSDEDVIPSQMIEMRINHYQNTGIGEGLFLVFLVQIAHNIGSDEWDKFYSTIEGFDYVPGNIYDLSVLVEKIDNPPADGSAFKYTVTEIKSVTAVKNETLFDVDLKINGQNFVTTDTDYEILNQIKIDCDTLCDELDEKIQNQNFVVGTFKRLQSDKIQLIELK